MIAGTERKHLGTMAIEDMGYLRKGAEPLTCISLFSGCGGAALGIREAGFEVRVMVEWEKAACNTLQANWVDRPENWREILKKEKVAYKRKLARIKDPTRRHVVAMQDTPHYWWQERPPAILNVDITKTTTEEILKAGELRVGEASLLEGGFPCQGFSMANSATDRADHTKDERNFLYRECVRVIREAMPKAFFLENVPGLVSMEKGRVIRMICDDLSASGYQVTWDIHDAADYGVPQRRRRVLIVGERNDVLTGYNGGMAFNIGGAAGPIAHPEWFEKKYPVKA